MNKKLIARGAAILLGVSSLAMVGVGAAVAYPGDCTSNRVCVYDNADFNTQLGWRAPGFALTNVSSGNNDKMSSWANSSSGNACWYIDVGGAGGGIDMPKHSQNSYVGATLNDKMSSWKGQSC